jgi:gamma-glutamyl:cysteine ligase YbdK (ATP-grasp superfamily)
MPSAEEAVRLLNLSLSLIPQVIAVSGNSRYVEAVDTDYRDTRMLLWERTHDTRTPIEIITNAPQRVGLPNKYFRNYEDYINFVLKFPFIINKPGSALRVGTGLIWTDARLKPRDKILLEFRPVSIQPSVEEDVAVCAFYVGLLEYYRVEDRPLPSLDVIRENRFWAMRHGLGAVFKEVEGGMARQVSARQVVEESLEKARLGLTAAGFEGGADCLEILRERVRNMRTPSDAFAARVKRAEQEGLSLEEALRKAVRECVVAEERRG